MSVPEASPPPAQRFRLMPVLVASLALNLLVAGLALGLFFGAAKRGGPTASDHIRRAGPERAGPPTIGLSPRLLLSSLPPERRAPLVAAIRDGIAGQRELGDEARAARMAAIAALEAEPFDATAAEAALARWRTKQNEVLALTHRFLVEIAATMSAAERKAALESVHKGARFGPGDGSALRKLREFRRERETALPPGAETGPSPQE